MKSERISNLYITAILLIVCLVCTQAPTQANPDPPDTGLPPYGSISDGNFDAINRQNLNVNFSIPIVSKPGRGIAFSHSLVYDSSFWRILGGAWTSGSNEQGNASFGWNTGSSAGWIEYDSDFELCYDDIEGQQLPVGSTSTYSDFRYVDATGAIHPFDVSFTHVSGPPAACGTSTGARTGFATNESNYFLDATQQSNPRVFAGSTIVSNGSDDVVLRDRNGNVVTRTSISAGEDHWIDTLGEVALKVIEQPGFIDYQYQDQSGNYSASTTVRLNLQNYSIQTAFGCAGVSEFSGTASLPSSIVLPSGLTYGFEYENSPGNPGSTTGRIHRVTLPTGGSYEYEYFGNNGGIDCADGSTLGLRQKVSDGQTVSTWEFSRSLVAGTTDTWNTTIVEPLLSYNSEANHVVAQFDDGKEVARWIYEGTVSANNLRLTVTRTWDSDGRPESRTITLSNGKTLRDETDYDANGNLLETRVFDFGDGVPGPILQTTSRTYVTDPAYVNLGIRDLVDEIIVREGGPAGTIVSRTKHDYDDYGAMPLICITDAPGHDEDYDCSFTNRGNPTAITMYEDPSDEQNPIGAIVSSYQYDSVGNRRVFEIDGVQQRAWTYSLATGYWAADSITEGAVGGPQLTTSATYNRHLGLLETRTDANDQTTTYTFDSFNRPHEVIRPDGAILLSEYDSVARTVTQSIPIQGSERKVITTFFDGLGRDVRTEVASNATPPVVYAVTEKTYDEVGRASGFSKPADDSSSQWATMRFDSMGRVTHIIPPGGSANFNSNLIEYDGHVVTTTDPSGNQLRYEQDVYGRVAKTIEPDPATNALSLETSFQYDALGSLIEIAQGAQTRTYDYDALGRLVSEMTPEGGMNTFHYLANGLIDVATDARGVTAQYTYDGLRRLTHVAYDVSGTAVPATAPVTYAYGTDASLNENGRLIQISNGSSIDERDYDLLGRLTESRTTIDQTIYTTQYGYNLAGSVTRTTYPSGRVVDRQYDALGRLAQISSGSVVYASNATYNAVGQMTGFTYGNGIQAELSYDPQRSQLNSIRYLDGAAALFDLDYIYDQGQGNTGQLLRVASVDTPARSVSYQYDALGRLELAESDGGSGGGQQNCPTGQGGKGGNVQQNPSCGGSGGGGLSMNSFPKWKLAFDYDRYGNRLEQDALIAQTNSNDPQTPNGTLGYDIATNRISDSGFVYDVNGNLLDDGSTSRTFDATDRVVNATRGLDSHSYSYDAQGLRIKKSALLSQTVYIYSGAQVIAEYSNGVLSREFIPSGGGILATHEGSELSYHHQDHLSVRMTTDAMGSVSGEQGHYPFGELWYERDRPKTNREFTNYERDEETGSDYAIQRHYEYDQGRFASVDPVSGQADNPQSLNRYAYVANDPINSTDPLGLMGGVGHHPWDIPPLSLPGVRSHLKKAATWGVARTAIDLGLKRFGVGWAGRTGVHAATTSKGLFGELDYAVGNARSFFLTGMEIDTPFTSGGTEPMFIEIKTGRFGVPHKIVNPLWRPAPWAWTVAIYEEWQRASRPVRTSVSTREYWYPSPWDDPIPLGASLWIEPPKPNYFAHDSLGAHLALSPNESGYHCSGRTGNQLWGCEYNTVIGGGGPGESAIWENIWNLSSGGGSGCITLEGIDICGGGGGSGPRGPRLKY